MPKLIEFLIQGNNFTEVPDNLNLIGATLKSLYIGDNYIVNITEQSFNDLKNLAHLNISALIGLTEISPGSLSSLTSLEVLIANDNHNLSIINLSGLRGLKNLRQVN